MAVSFLLGWGIAGRRVVGIVRHGSILSKARSPELEVQTQTTSRYEIVKNKTIFKIKIPWDNSSSWN
jgi:hypothetical protein